MQYENIIIGNLIFSKSLSSDTVYFINNGKKIGIPDVPTFDLLHFNWGNLQVLADAQVAVIPLAYNLPSLANGNVISSGNEPEASYIEAGKRRVIPDPETLTSLGKTFNDIIHLDAVFFDLITVGTPYSSIVLDSPKIISISPSTATPSQIILTINGTKFDDTCIDEIYNESHQMVYSGINNGGLNSRNDNQLVIKENLASLSLGNYTVYVKNSKGQKSNGVIFSIKSEIAEGNLIVGTSDKTVYYVRNGKKIGIPDLDTFNLLGFDWAKIMILPDAQVMNIPLDYDFRQINPLKLFDLCYGPKNFPAYKNKNF